MWKEQYRLGVDEVDNQHKELFERLSTFIKVVRGDMKWEQKIPEIKKTLKFMEDYVAEHFESEEKYQQQINYPGYEKHHEIHEQFKANIKKFADLFENKGYEEDLVQEFSGKLMTWLIKHVTGDDQQISNFVKSQKEGTDDCES
jgi:hemerythrin